MSKGFRLEGLSQAIAGKSQYRKPVVGIDATGTNHQCLLWMLMGDGIEHVGVRQVILLREGAGPTARVPGAPPASREGREGLDPDRSRLAEGGVRVEVG